MGKEKIIQEVAEKYHHLLRKNNFFPDYNQELEFYDETKKVAPQKYDWTKFILNVETSYFAMPYHLRKIIKSDFFYQNYSFWWEEIYSKKQYKKYREEAIDTFYSNLIKTNVLTKDGEMIEIDEEKKTPLQPKVEQPKVEHKVGRNEKIGELADKIVFDNKRIGVLVMKKLTEKNDGHIVNNEYNDIIINSLKRLPYNELQERSQAKDYDFNSHLFDVASDESDNLTDRDKWFILRQHTDIEKIHKDSWYDARYEFGQDLQDCILMVLKEARNDYAKSIKSKDKGMER